MLYAEDVIEVGWGTAMILLKDRALCNGVYLKHKRSGSVKDSENDILNISVISTVPVGPNVPCCRFAQPSSTRQVR